MQKAQQEYARNAVAFSSTRKRNRLSLRDVSKITGVHFLAVFRFDHRKPISAIHYIALCEWTSQENPAFKI
jgi:hypothetical protein